MSGETNTLPVPGAIQSMPPAPIMGTSIFLNMQRFVEAQRVAQMLSASTLIPEHFRGNIGNCVIALNLAERLNVDPFMLMQTMYVVHGRPGIEGKLAIALVEGTGRFSPLKFKFDGSGKTDRKVDRPDSCVAYATELKSGEVLQGPKVTWAMADAEGWLKGKQMKNGGGEIPSKWHTLPELMFMYRSATFFARTHCPGALLGLRTTDELDDMSITMEPTATGAYEVEKPELTSAPEIDVDATFNGTIPEGTDKAVLDVFLESTAKRNNTTVEAVKREAITKAEEFWKIFNAYLKTRQQKNGKAKTEAPATPPAPNGQGTETKEYAPGECPETPGTIYIKEFCDACKKRQGCPVWSAVDGKAK